MLGGYFTDHLTWRWCFYVNVPFGLLTMVVVALVLKLPKPTGRRRFDVLGTLLLTAASTCLVLLTSWGGTEYAWDSRRAGPRRGRRRGHRRLPGRRAVRRRTAHPAAAVP
ncbi:hypothetical protein ACFQV4_12000 [Streptomyces thermocarboxydus]